MMFDLPKNKFVVKPKQVSMVLFSRKTSHGMKIPVSMCTRHEDQGQ